MDKDDNLAYRPDYAVAPGEVLEHELDIRGMSKSELARRTGLTEKHINAIVRAKGKSVITPETAIKLERALNMPVDYWLALEANYQEVRARLAETENLIGDIEWLKRIPVAAMVKNGWINKFKDKGLQLEEVLRFFGIASVAQWDDVWPKLQADFRQHTKQEIFPEAVSAWLRQGQRIAAEMGCSPFDKSQFRQVLTEVRKLTKQTDPSVFVPELQRHCAKAGVAVVFVPALPKTGVSGATHWANANKAIIQLSLRYGTNDHLWFTFFHEAGHILLHGKKELFLEGKQDMDQTKEAEANDFAEKELIPKKAFAEFAAITPYSKAAIRAFAKQMGVAPGIVVGQLQFKELMPKSHCNDLKVRYRWN